jgi:hypothetical protein
MRLQNRHGWVDIVEQTLTPRFVIVGSSGYRAELTSCPCEMSACPIVVARGGRHNIGGKAPGRAWSTHCREFCHGVHRPYAEHFAAKVLKTYGIKVGRL